jgi:secreted trypsin-like serine protease
MLASGAASADPAPVARIINGQPVGVNEADFYVALIDRYSWDTGTSSGSTYNQFCGATHIGDGMVLTAAHCVDNLIPNAMRYLLFGDTSADMANEYCYIDKQSPAYHCTTDINGTPDDTLYEPTGYLAYAGDTSNLIPFRGLDVRIHESWNPNYGFVHDIAVIELNSIFNYPAASLPDTNGFDYSASIDESGGVVAIGYGDTKSDSDVDTYEPSDDLLKVELNALTDSECRATLGNSYRPSYMVCATNDSGGDTCQGDSGGPLVRPDDQVLYGITSHGALVCGSAPGVYTEVLAYRDWILNGAAANVASSTPDANSTRRGGATSFLSLVSVLLIILRRHPYRIRG